MANGNGGTNWLEMVGKLGFGVIALYILLQVLNAQADAQAKREEQMYELMVERAKEMTIAFKAMAEYAKVSNEINERLAKHAEARSELMKSFLELERSNQTLLRDLLKGRDGR